LPLLPTPPLLLLFVLLPFLLFFLVLFRLLPLMA
jgi:hypothetical protein